MGNNRGLSWNDVSILIGDKDAHPEVYKAFELLQHMPKYTKEDINVLKNMRLNNHGDFTISVSDRKSLWKWIVDRISVDNVFIRAYYTNMVKFICVPYEDLPLYMDADEEESLFINWRFRIGK